jgi:hypothetical protein
MRLRTADEAGLFVHISTSRNKKKYLATDYHDARWSITNLRAFLLAEDVLLAEYGLPLLATP